MPQLPPQLQLIRNYLQENYLPTANYLAADIRVSTDELHGKLWKMFPDPEFSPEILFAWMRELGFQFKDVGEMKLEWMLCKRHVL